MTRTAAWRSLALILLAPVAAAAQAPPKQAVLETSAGTIVLDLLSDAAPRHVAAFVASAESGIYDGTTFFRMVRMGLIHGGDPATKDPAARAKYGSGTWNLVKAEPNTLKHLRGAVSAVELPGRPDSGGTQFFICVTDQPGLDGAYTVFARVAEGILVAQKIAETPVDASGLAIDRVVVTRVSIRDRPPEAPEPFSTEPVEALAAIHAVLETSMGDITVSFTPDKAPMHVRNFLRLAEAGVYDGMSFHRVVKGFVIQSGYLPSRAEPLSEAQQKVIRPLKAEFNDTAHDAGVLSMARGDDPDSATSSFFIVTARSAALDGKYTAFGKVDSGMDVVRAIESAAVAGETPVEPVELRRVRIVRP